MANMVDYLAWRGEFGLELTPWNEVDALLFATLSYLNFHGTDNALGWTLAEAERLELLNEATDSYFEKRKKMFLAMAESRRFGDCRMHHYIAETDLEKEMQFSAVCYDLPDNTLVVAFRGTDSTVIGWREDLNMSLLKPVPAQEAAKTYLEHAAGMDDRPIRLTGHSKGGNLAAYAAACVSPEIQDRIREVYTFDGPGMSPDVFQSEGYRNIAPKIRSYVPQTSIVGMMMEYHRNYTVVHSDAAGIQQHDPLTWQVYGPHFECVESIDETAKTISDTLHDWLKLSDQEERAMFLDVAFGMIESTRATTVSEIMGEKIRNLRSLISSGRDLDPERKKEFNRLLGVFLSAGVGNVIERGVGNVIEKYLPRKAEEKKGRAPQEEAAEAGDPAEPASEAAENTSDIRQDENVSL